MLFYVCNLFEGQGKAKDSLKVLTKFRGFQAFSLYLPRRIVKGSSKYISGGGVEVQSLGAKNISATFFRTKFFDNPSGHGRPRRKSWTSAPKRCVFLRPCGGEKAQECPQEIWTNKICLFNLCFSYTKWIFLVAFLNKRIVKSYSSGPPGCKRTLLVTSGRENSLYKALHDTTKLRSSK